ncbi:MAG: hypothetical protein JXR96_19050 [Deltaproteobacteria bacterium]|nr:hypothetical protein [Deltaproteobacteria bacterium]
MSLKAERKKAPKGQGPSDGDILRALVDSSRRASAESDAFWVSCHFEPDALAEALSSLAGRSAASAKRLKAFAHDFAGRYRLSVSSVDDLAVSAFGSQVHLPRPLVGEALGALGSALFPTRRRVRRLACSTARELAYFGYGRLEELVLPHPIGLVRAALAGEDSVYLEPVLLDEAGEELGRRWSVFGLLAQDESFHREIEGEAELARFQERLREDPLDGNMVVRLREFFSKRATIGVRDTGRWLLGSRHPWFGWQRARELIAECFERWGTESFTSRSVILLAPDVEMGDDALEARLEENGAVCDLVTRRLQTELPARVSAKIDAGSLRMLAGAVLDCHHDHPDFDLEARESRGDTTARFVGHALYVMGNHLLGHEAHPRQNTNFRAHFESKGVTRQWLGGLGEEDLEDFFRVLTCVMSQYAEQGGLLDSGGRVCQYRRLPYLIYTFHASPEASPRPGEEVLDSFPLSELRLPQHAHHLRAYPEIFEKLLVFFVLVLRHYLDTRHVPDLHPPRLVRDFMLLGLWGTNTSKVLVHLYRNAETGKVRSEIRLVGRGHSRAHWTEEERRQEAALTRLAASRFGPLVEPSLLRAVGTFSMAAEESLAGSRVQELGTLAFTRQSLEVFREAARTGIRGTLVDLATALEVLVDNSVDLAQRGLDRIARQVGIGQDT